VTVDRLDVDIGNVELVATFVLALAFVVTYAITVRWWVGRAGRNVMALMAVIVAVVGLSIVRIFWTNSASCTCTSAPAWFIWLRVSVFALVPIVIGWRLYLLVHVQFIEPRRTRVADDESRRLGGDALR